jgi:hypothetical protein
VRLCEERHRLARRYPNKFTQGDFPNNDSHHTRPAAGVSNNDRLLKSKTKNPNGYGQNWTTGGVGILALERYNRDWYLPAVAWREYRQDFTSRVSSTRVKAVRAWKR